MFCRTRPGRPTDRLTSPLQHGRRANRFLQHDRAARRQSLERHKFFFKRNLFWGAEASESRLTTIQLRNYLIAPELGPYFRRCIHLSPYLSHEQPRQLTRFVEPQTTLSLNSTSWAYGHICRQCAANPAQVSFTTLRRWGSDGVFERLDIFQIFLKSRGAHSLKFGVDPAILDRSSAGYTNGTFVLGTNWTTAHRQLAYGAHRPDLAAFLHAPTSDMTECLPSEQEQLLRRYLQDDSVSALV